jgi:hypothetical protein
MNIYYLEPLGGKVTRLVKPRGREQPGKEGEPKGVQIARHTPPKTFKIKRKDNNSFFSFEVIVLPLVG